MSVSRIPSSGAGGAALQVVAYSGSAYPARPSGVPAGQVRYVGPTQPGDRLDGDEWVNTSAVAVTQRTVPDLQVGDWITNPCLGTAIANQPNGELRLGCMWLPEGTYDRVMFNVDVAGSTGSATKAVVYTEQGGRLGSLLLDSATIATTTNGDKTITGTSLVIPSGGLLVWAGVVTLGTPSTLPTLVQVDALPTQRIWAGIDPIVGFVTAPSLRVTGITGAAPATPTATQVYRHASLALRRGA